MNASYEHIEKGIAHKQLWVSLPAFEFYWHYHPEAELTFICKGSGQRMVGDHIGSFSAGDLVLVGPDLPHTWTSAGGESGQDACQAVVVQFDVRVFDELPDSLPGFEAIRNLLRLSAGGLSFSPAVAREAGRRMMLLRKKQGLPWLLGFWSILDFLGHSDGSAPLASPGYAPSLKSINQERITKVFQYLANHFTGHVSLEQAAGLVCMTATSFSRFFRKNTGVTFNSYLNDLRIGHACRLLTGHPEKSVSEAGWESGFRSSTHFNRMFQAKKSCTPSEYRKIKNP